MTTATYSYFFNEEKYVVLREVWNNIGRRNVLLLPISLLSIVYSARSQKWTVRTARILLAWKQSWKHVWSGLLESPRLSTAGLLPDYYPATIFVDLEIAIHGALCKVWPLSTLAGCRFYLGQSWNHKIQQLGLQSLYQKPGYERSFLRTFYGLPFLQPEEVEDFIHVDLSPLAPESAKIDNFVECTSHLYYKRMQSIPPSFK